MEYYFLLILKLKEIKIINHKWFFHKFFNVMGHIDCKDIGKRYILFWNTWKSTIQSSCRNNRVNLSLNKKLILHSINELKEKNPLLFYKQKQKENFKRKNTTNF